ncbi:MAG: hypothetical protein ACI4D9_00740 [Lachnospiraceae bacterium]
MNEWINHPAMKNIDPAKLELIRAAAKQTEGKRGKAMAPIMMALITSANKKGIQFTPDEVSLIISILKEGKSEKEQAQIEQTIKMVTSYMKKPFF